ncbi:MAG: hypothetical protein PHG66_06415 [Candidatus Colwellbacteria bacterium]|nr:hypothetical protein [Candidatus Colwellbacteria bacterium]
MGNKSVVLALPEHKLGLIGYSYHNTRSLYLQKSLLGGQILTDEPLEEKDQISDNKFRIRQYTMPPGCLIKITHSSIPHDGIGFGFFGPITPELRGTIVRDDGELADVTVDKIIHVLKRV